MGNEFNRFIARNSKEQLALQAKREALMEGRGQARGERSNIFRVGASAGICPEDLLNLGALLPQLRFALLWPTLSLSRGAAHDVEEADGCHPGCLCAGETAPGTRSEEG